MVLIIRHVFVLSSLAIAFIAIFMAFSGMLDGPGAHYDLRGNVVNNIVAPAAMARNLAPAESDPAGKP